MSLTLALHERQSLAFESPATEILYGGAAGGGKSHLMRCAAIAWACAIPGLQVYLFRRTYPDLFKNHLEGPSGFPALLADWTSTGAASVNLSRNYIEIGQSRIHLCHCQYEKDVFAYQGAEIHVLLPDELTHFTRNQYVFLRSRVRLGGLQVPPEYKGMFPRIVAGSNPGGIGHNWVKAMFVDAAPPLDIWTAPRDDGGMRRQFIPALLEDNPTLMENDPDYETRLEGLGDPMLVRAMRRGDWDITSGGMFDDLWKRDKHAIAPFKVPASWYVDRSFDWGSGKPYSVGWWAESDGTEVTLADGSRRTFPRGSLIRIAEDYGWNGKANEGCRMLAVEVAKRVKDREQNDPWLKGLRVRPGPADNAIKDAENGVCIADDMAKLGVKWTDSDKTPGSRKNGWERIRKMLKAASEPVPEEAGLWVFNTCTHFIRTVPTLPRDERKPEDVDTDAEDHIGDEVRYRIMAPRIRVERVPFPMR